MMPDFHCLSAHVGLLMLSKGEFVNCSPSLLPEPSFLQEHVSVFSGFQLSARQLHKRRYEPSGACASCSPASCAHQRMPRPRDPGPPPPLAAAARGRHGHGSAGTEADPGIQRARFTSACCLRAGRAHGGTCRGWIYGLRPTG